MKNIHMISPYQVLISKYSLFSQIAADEIPDVIHYLNGKIKEYDKGELLLALGAPFSHAGFVLSGTVEGSFISENYNKININHFSAGKSFGEALAVTQTKHSPIQLRALTDCVVLFLDLHILFLSESLVPSYLQRLSMNLAMTLAQQNVFSNLKLRISSQKSIRDRVLMYLFSLSPNEEGMLVIPFSQTALAEFLGVNRSALSRELGNMQDEGLIFAQGRYMKLLL